MALEARCRNDSGRLRSCPHWNRSECRCRRAVRSPNAANPATSSRALFGHADGCWIAGAAAAVFFSGWFRGQGNVRLAVRDRLRVRFGFQSIWVGVTQKIASSTCESCSGFGEAFGGSQRAERQTPPSPDQINRDFLRAGQRMAETILGLLVIRHGIRRPTGMVSFKIGPRPQCLRGMG